MSLHEKIFYKVTDSIHKIFPHKKPSPEKLKHCKLISHRGEHNNKVIFENTIEAFELAAEAGVWGIEFDLRWTKDLIPVISHDANLKRIFDIDQTINKINYKELKDLCPLIPSLQEVIERYGKRLHLMIEIKQEYYPNKTKQKQKLANLLSKLTPIKDYHIISIYPEMFEYIDFLPTRALLPIAIVSYRKKNKITFERDYGGVLGHYQLISRKGIRKHIEQGRNVGVGFITSKNSLYRELNRGIEWIFTDKACYLQSVIDKM